MNYNWLPSINGDRKCGAFFDGKFVRNVSNRECEDFAPGTSHTFRPGGDAALITDSFIAIDTNLNCSLFTKNLEYVSLVDESACQIRLRWTRTGNCGKFFQYGETALFMGYTTGCEQKAVNPNPHVSAPVPAQTSPTGPLGGFYNPPVIQVCGGMIVVEGGVVRVVPNPACRRD
jgi:hypothetical protein